MDLWSKKILQLGSDCQDSKNAPKIEIRNDGHTVVASINRFPPGAIIEIVYMDQRMPRNTAETLKGIAGYVRVEAPGQILESSPPCGGVCPLYPHLFRSRTEFESLQP